MLLLSWYQVAKGSIRTRRKKKRRREKQVEGEERYDGAVFFHTISVSPCTATPLYNSTGRLNILRMLSSLFVSKHEPSGDLQIMQISNNVNKNWIFYYSKHVLYSSIITQSSWSKKKNLRHSAGLQLLLKITVTLLNTGKHDRVVWNSD